MKTYILLFSIIFVFLASQTFAGSVTVTGADLSPSFTPGNSVPIVRLSFTDIVLLPSITSIKVDRAGSAANADVPTAKLYKDANQNNIIDGGDSQLSSTQTFSGSPASVTFSGLGYSPSASENLLIVYDIASGANTSTTVGVEMQSGYISGMLTSVSFSGITTGNQPLPIELISFTVCVKSDGSVELVWRTAAEKNNYGFEIERVFNNTNTWQKIDFVQGRGTSNVPYTYVYNDNSVKSGNYQYRLKQIDHNGLFIYSDQVEVSVNLSSTGFSLSQNFPNPFNPKTDIIFSLPKSAWVHLVVYNSLGQLITTLIQQEMEPGTHRVELVADNWSSGVYYYRLETPHGSHMRKLVYIK